MSYKFDPKVELPTFGIAWHPYLDDEEMDGIAKQRWNDYVELTKSKLRFEYRTCVLDSRHRQRIRDMYAESEVWTQRSGKPILIENMTPDHAHNARRMMERRLASDAARLQVAVSLLAESPLMSALRRRSQEPETFIDWVRDYRSKRRYEKGQK